MTRREFGRPLHGRKRDFKLGKHRVASSDDGLDPIHIFSGYAIVRRTRHRNHVFARLSTDKNQRHPTGGLRVLSKEAPIDSFLPQAGSGGSAKIIGAMSADKNHPRTRPRRSHRLIGPLAPGVLGKLAPE